QTPKDIHVRHTCAASSVGIRCLPAPPRCSARGAAGCLVLSMDVVLSMSTHLNILSQHPGIHGCLPSDLSSPHGLTLQPMRDGQSARLPGCQSISVVVRAGQTCPAPPGLGSCVPRARQHACYVPLVPWEQSEADEHRPREGRPPCLCLPSSACCSTFLIYP